MFLKNRKFQLNIVILLLTTHVHYYTHDYYTNYDQVLGKHMVTVICWVKTRECFPNDLGVVRD